MLRDKDIRRALLQAMYGRQPKLLVIEEMGLDRNRADIAVLDDNVLWAYEIKSDVDVLDRLPSQVEGYSEVFDGCWLVTTRRHLEHAVALLPDWWGVALASRQAYGIRVEVHRPAGRNPNRDSRELLGLLWRDEALGLLERIGQSKGMKSKTRTAMHKKLKQHLTFDRARVKVHEALRSRKDWLAT